MLLRFGLFFCGQKSKKASPIFGTIGGPPNFWPLAALVEALVGVAAALASVAIALATLVEALANVAAALAEKVRSLANVAAVLAALVKALASAAVALAALVEALANIAAALATLVEALAGVAAALAEQGNKKAWLLYKAGFTVILNFSSDSTTVFSSTSPDTMPRRTQRQRRRQE